MRRGLFGALSPSMEVSTMLRNISIACLYLLLTCSAVRGEDKYYAVVFGYQDRNNRCCEAHSFATFVQVRQAITAPEVVDQATISWLPARGIVKLFKRAERGINHPLGLEQYAIAKGGWDYQGPALLEAPSTAIAGMPTPATKTASR
jgi:hypothetical protein